jgi:hypothetical protein
MLTRCMLIQQIVDPIEVPLSLDLRAYATSSSSSTSLPTATTGRYTLSAVVVHEGSLEYGHYWAFVKIKGAGHAQWVRCNDQEVVPVDEQVVLQAARGEATLAAGKARLHRAMGSDAFSTNAYLLFYTEIDDME